MNTPKFSSSDLAITVIHGDGIGPELIDSALAVLEAAVRSDGRRLRVAEEPGGARQYERTGAALADGALDRLRAADGVLKGPVGLPGVRHPDGTEAGLLGGLLRNGLDTYANVRPMHLLPGVVSPTRHQPEAIDHVIVRENTEGLYLSRGAGVATPDAASDQMLITRVGTERICRHAFDLAERRAGARRDSGCADPTPRVTCVDKSNVLRSFALFRTVFDEVAVDYPDVATDHLYADAAGHALVAHPERFDVLVMENFLGDVLSDVAAATVGGLGMCGSGNIGTRTAYFEPIHGSAPDIAGADRANPVSQVLSSAMLLDHVGQPAAAERIRDAVGASFWSGALALQTDGCPVGGTRAATGAIIAHLSG